jgi:hypothetical protein
VHHRGFRPGGPVVGDVLASHRCGLLLLRLSAATFRSKPPHTAGTIPSRTAQSPSGPLLRYVSLHALPINVLNESCREPGKTLRAFVTALSRSALSYLLAFPATLDYTLPA